MPGIETLVAAAATALGAGAAAAATIGTVVNAVVVVGSVVSAVKTARSMRSANSRRATMTDNQRNAEINFRDPIAPRRIIYGRARVGGPIIYATNTEPDNITIAWFVIALAGHRVDEIEEFYLSGSALTHEAGSNPSGSGALLGKFRTAVNVWGFEGAAGQNIGEHMLFHGLSAAYISTSDKMSNISAIVARTVDFGKQFDGQAPEFSAKLRGKRVFDPRNNSTAWSDNPALCAADYLEEYMGFPRSTIHLETLIASANICDESVPLKGGGSQKRYIVGGVIPADTTHSEAIDQLAQSMAGSIRYSSGVWYIEAGAPKAQSHVFSENNVLESYTLQVGKPDRALPNGVRGTYIASANDYQPNSYPSFADSAAVAAEGQEQWLELDLPLVTSHQRAQRIARALLRRARSAESMSIVLDLRGLVVRPGDVVGYDCEALGLDGSELWEVDACTVIAESNRLAVQLDLMSYDPNAYAWNPNTDEAELPAASVIQTNIRARRWQGLGVVETVASTSGIFIATYGFSGTPPNEAKSKIESVQTVVTVDITTNDGSGNSTERRTSTRNGSTLGFDDVQWTLPAGHTYVSHSFVSATAQAFFEDGKQTPKQAAELIAP